MSRIGGRFGRGIARCCRDHAVWSRGWEGIAGDRTEDGNGGWCCVTHLLLATATTDVFRCWQWTMLSCRRY